jgi:hypothetical protein
MATAEEILRSVALQPDPEGHIIVGGDRFIKIPDSLKRLAVQYDNNMETVTFDCPRYWDNRDMSQMAIYINYMLSNGYTDRYPVGNVRADGDIMHFDWTISKNVSQVAGTVSFLVCVMKTDGEGNEERHWNSELSQEAYVSKGLEAEEHPALDYPDEVTQLLLRMATVEQINVQADEMRQLLTDTQEAAVTTQEAKEQVLDASDYIKNTYAPAIKGNVSGDSIRVDDVSPIEHDVKCRVHGKNLFDATKIPIGVGVSSNYITASGQGFVEITSLEQYDGNGHVSTGIKLRELCPQMRPGKQYTLSAKSDAFNQCIYLAQIDYFWHFNNTIVISEDMLDCGVGLYGYAPYRGQQYGVCRISDIMIEEGHIKTEYEPYIDPTTVNLTGYGKNLWHTNNFFVYPYTQLGLTISYNEKTNTYSFNGTSTSPAMIYVIPRNHLNLKVKKGAVLRFRAEVIGGTSKDSDGITDVTKNIAPLVTTRDDSKRFSSQSGVHVFEEDTILSNMYFYVYKAGIVFNKLTMRVQLEFNDSTEFEAYNGEITATPASDGTCIVVSKSPTMTLLTDTPGITIEAEYNRDTTKMFESYVLSDKAKREIASIVGDNNAEVIAYLNSYAESIIGGDA